ncbi:MAG: hypothetical protein LBE36_10065 [Flavobacteriaceae bacterium]|jgi:hypothetical protein|nr:hypothetical protein [Flavobacteriaceae bacterium]
MGLFDFFKKDKKEKTITNSIGEFTFLKIHGENQWKGIINSKINDKIEVLFPMENENISTYQIEYFKRIENAWDSIFKQLLTMKPNMDFKDYKVTSMLIPDQENEVYDMDAEIVLQKGENIFSLILEDLNLDEVIED